MGYLTRSEIEDTILGMGDIIFENKQMRKRIAELELEVARNKAWLYHKDELKEKLDKRISENLSYNLVQSAGWSSSDEFYTLEDMNLTEDEYRFCKSTY